MKAGRRSKAGYSAEKWNMAFMFPAEIAKARKKTGLVILPIAPLEWHGPHMTMGCDTLEAHAFARKLAKKLRSPYFPPLFIGTERARSPETLEAIGFDRSNFIEGMDFPKNAIASAYYREETFAIVMRDTLNILFDRMRFRKILIVNGHGAQNQDEVLTRLCREYNAVSAAKRVIWVYPGFLHWHPPGAHAGAEECSFIEAAWPGLTDLSRLPKKGRLKNTDYGIVDSDTFNLNPTKDHTLRENSDPRFHTDARKGELIMERSAREAAVMARKTLLGRTN